MDRTRLTLDHDKQSDARHTLYGLINTYVGNESSVLDAEHHTQRTASAFTLIYLHYHVVLVNTIVEHLITVSPKSVVL